MAAAALRVTTERKTPKKAIATSGTAKAPSAANARPSACPDESRAPVRSTIGLKPHAIVPSRDEAATEASVTVDVMPSRRSNAGRLAAAAIVLAAATATALAVTSRPSGAASRAPSLAQLVGQTIVVRMRGSTPGAGFLARVRRGEVGGVVLFSENYGSAGPGRLVRQLQAAATAGRQPPLLIAIDQEGGIVKRLPGPPTSAPPQMLSATVARAQGLATGRYLAGFGINTDLAPVLDVGRGGFITSRSFGATAAEVASRGLAFADGLTHGGVLATAKHFPGLGHAQQTTDTSQTVVKASGRALEADLLPFRAAIAEGVPLVMLSTAAYPSLGARVPAACSEAIVRTLLRGRLGFRGVAVTDALDTPAVHTSFSTGAAAEAALRAGVDLVLALGVTSRDADTVSQQVFGRLLRDARSGALPRRTLEQAYARVLALKSRLPR